MTGHRLLGETYLVLKRSVQGYRKLIIKEAKKKMPALASDEIAIKINVSIPESYFAQHIPQVEIDVPEAAIIKPVVEVDMPADE